MWAAFHVFQFWEVVGKFFHCLLFIWLNSNDIVNKFSPLPPLCESLNWKKKKDKSSITSLSNSDCHQIIIFTYSCYFFFLYFLKPDTISIKFSSNHSELGRFQLTNLVCLLMIQELTLWMFKKGHIFNINLTDIFHLYRPETT